MTDPAKRERAASDVLEILPYRWALGPTSYDPASDAGPTPLEDRIPDAASVPRGSPGRARTSWQR